MSTYAPYTYANTLGGTEFTIPFDYIDESHLSVYVNDVRKTLKKDYWIDRNNNKIVFRSSTTAGHPVRIERSTPSTIKFRNGSPLTQQQFNNLIKEELLFFQEQQFLKTEGNLLCRNNLSDVASSSSARENLGVYSSSDISGKADLYLENANNLSDLHDVPTARTNLDIYSKGETSTLIADHVPGWISGAIVEPLTGVDQRFKLMQCQLVYTDIDTITLNPHQGDYVVVGETVRQLTSITGSPAGLGSNTIYYVYLNFSGSFSLSYSTTAPNTTYCGIRGKNTGTSFTPVVGIFITNSYGKHSTSVFSWYNPKSIILEESASTLIALDEDSPKQGATIQNILVPAGYNYYIVLNTQMYVSGHQGWEALDGKLEVTGGVSVTKQYHKWNHDIPYAGWSDCIELRGSVTTNQIIHVKDWVYGLSFHDPLPIVHSAFDAEPSINSVSTLTVIVSP